MVVPTFFLCLLHHFVHRGAGRLAPSGGSPWSAVSGDLERALDFPCFLSGFYVSCLSQQVSLDCCRKGVALRLEVEALQWEFSYWLEGR